VFYNEYTYSRGSILCFLLVLNFLLSLKRRKKEAMLFFWGGGGYGCLSGRVDPTASSLPSSALAVAALASTTLNIGLREVRVNLTVTSACRLPRIRWGYPLSLTLNLTAVTLGLTPNPDPNPSTEVTGLSVTITLNQTGLTLGQTPNPDANPNT